MKKSISEKMIAKIAALFLAAVLLMAIQVTAYAEETSENTVIRIPISQQFSTNDSNANKEFAYTFEPQPITINAPMPDGSVNGVYSFRMSGDVSTEIIIKSSQVGQYFYQLKQNVEEKKQYYEYDTSVYQVYVEIQKDDNNQLAMIVTIENEKGEKVSSAAFKNSFVGKKDNGGNPPSSQTPNNNSTGGSSYGGSNNNSVGGNSSTVSNRNTTSGGGSSVLQAGGRAKTSDESKPVRYITIMIISAIGMFLLFCKRREDEKEEGDKASEK